jgi:hypothetical protein
MKVMVRCEVIKEVTINEKIIKQFFDIEKYKDSDDIDYYLKNNKDKPFYEYLDKLETELNTKMNGLEDIQILSLEDEEDNTIYEN